jgi:hypothetical protein
MRLFNQLDSGSKTPIFDQTPQAPTPNPEDAITPMQLHELPNAQPQLSELETTQIQQQEAFDMTNVNLERVHIYLNKYCSFTNQIAEITKKKFKDEIIQSFNQPDQKLN